MARKHLNKTPESALRKQSTRGAGADPRAVQEHYLAPQRKLPEKILPTLARSRHCAKNRRADRGLSPHKAALPYRPRWESGLVQSRRWDFPVRLKSYHRFLFLPHQIYAAIRILPSGPDPAAQRERILFKGDQGEGRRQIKILWRRGDSGVGVFRRFVMCDSGASLPCVNNSRLVNVHTFPTPKAEKYIQ
jgi:hypothetical protein